MWLPYRNLAGQRIAGSLPPEYSTLIGLVDCFLEDNSLTGTLPEAYSVLGNYHSFFLDVPGNQLSGTLPSCWSAMSATLRM